MPEPYTIIPSDKIRVKRLLFCPHCNAKTSHRVEWLVSPLTLEQEYRYEKSNGNIRQYMQYLKSCGLEISIQNNRLGVTLNYCDVCQNVIMDMCRRQDDDTYAVMRVLPRELAGQLPLPNEDMPEKCKSTYQEAVSVFDASPRAAAGLMRLCLQQLCQELAVQGKTLDEQIATLVKAGVPKFIQEYMDVCRCVGNSSVHPNVEIDVNEDPDVAKGLFTAMNIIVENLISIPKRASEAYAALPANFRKHVEERDKK